MTLKKRRRKIKLNPTPIHKEIVRVVGEEIVVPILITSSRYGTYVSGSINDVIFKKDNIPIPYEEIGKEVELENPKIGNYKPIKQSTYLEDIV